MLASQRGSVPDAKSPSREFDADHDAELLLVDVVLDRDEGDRLGILQQEELADDQQAGVGLALREEDEDRRDAPRRRRR